MELDALAIFGLRPPTVGLSFYSVVVPDSPVLAPLVAILA
jgi:hypothetical protein